MSLFAIAIPLIAWVLVPATVLYFALRLVRAVERGAASAEEAVRLAHRTAEETARLSLKLGALEARITPPSGPSAV